MSPIDIERYQRPPIAEVLACAGIDTGAPPWRETPSGWRRGPCAICQSDNQRAFAYREDTGNWRCFECGAGGNVWALVMALEGCDFHGALALWRASGEPPGPPEDNDDIAHADVRPGDLRCPACSEMFRAGIDGLAIVTAHENARAGGHA